MSQLMIAILVGLSFVALYRNIVDTKRVRQQVSERAASAKWHHAAGMAALVLNVPQLAGAASHANIIYAFGALLAAGVWFGLRHRSEGLHTAH